MTMIDDIIRAEEQFFNNYLRRPTMIIVTPDGLAQLQEELLTESILNTDALGMGEFGTYEGLTVAVTTADRFPNFKLGFVG